MFTEFYFTGLEELNIRNGNYGGVRVKTILDTWIEENPVYNNDTEQYEPVKGSFDIIMRGPTVSGVKNIQQRLYRIAQYIKQNNQGKTVFPQKLRIENEDMMFNDLTITPWDHYTSVDALKSIRFTLEYIRKPYIYRTYLQYPRTFGGTKYDNDIPLMTTNTNSVKAPMHLAFVLYNQRPITPSGYFLFSNYRIHTISGGLFTYQSQFSSVKHTAQSNVDENSNFAYSFYNGDIQSGVQKTTPTILDVPIVSSGVIYGDGTWDFKPNVISARSADMYLVYKTVGNTEYDIEIKASWFGDSLSDYPTGIVSTGIKRLQNVPYPTVAYIGSVDSQGYMEQGLIQTSITPKTLLGGSLYIDRVIIHQKGDVSNTVQVSPVAVPLQSYGENTQTLTSGTIVYEFLNKHPSSSYQQALIKDEIPTLRVIRQYPVFPYNVYTNGGITVPPYKGDIDVYGKRLDPFLIPNSLVDPYGYANGYYNVLFVATGSTLMTTSGLNNWVYTDTKNIKAKIAMFVSKPSVRTAL